ncbi:MAG: heparinase [Pseudopedobacter saltans]|uniref:Heparinase n=1 Tax=Pseudopedobacter saltans TaxID=151895 RepID=A0A2W5F4V3_9SPHI|nr:MAG: heparinase [Pseudopedobacter saltans]
MIKVFYNRLFLLCGCLIFSIVLYAQQERNYLTKSVSVAQLAGMLSTKDEWVNFPSYENRAGWSVIDSSLRNDLIRKAVSKLDYKYQFVPSSAYLAFATTGDRGVMERPYAQNCNAVRDLVLGELMEGRKRFIPQIINGINNLIEMQTWALSAHLALQGKHKPGVIDSTQNIIDLGAGRTGAMLAWTYYFLQKELDLFKPGTSAKLSSEIQRRIVDTYEERNDFWWMALNGHKLVNNWNVWCNYNSLTCILLMEQDTKKKINAVYKTMRSVDKFINYYKDDGACEEGPSYWSEAGGNLYNYLSLIKSVTNNQIDLFVQPLVKNMAAYIYNVYIGNQYYVNFADAHAKIIPDPGLIYGFGNAIGDDKMKSFGAFLAKNERFNSGDIFETLNYLFEQKNISKTSNLPPLPKDVQYKETQITIGRDKENSLEGFYFAAKGGNNNESHNHNDIGSFILYYNSKPLLIDIGSGTYTAKTFSAKRYELFNTRSLNHNVPLINGIEQQAGAQFKSSSYNYRSSANDVSLSIGIESAYPDSANVDKWERSYLLSRGKSFTIKDMFSLKENNGKTSDNFVTAIKPIQVKSGELIFNVSGEVVKLKYEDEKMDYKLVSIPLTDPPLIKEWGNSLYRLEFILKKNILKVSTTITISK